MKSILLYFFLFTYFFSFSQESAFIQVEPLVKLMTSKAFEVDSILKSKGFANTEINGLKIIYTKNNERISFQSSPREAIFQTNIKESYLKISNEVSDNYTLISENDSLFIDAKTQKVSTFNNANFTFSFWTSLNNSKKINFYFVRIILNPQKNQGKIVSNNNLENEKGNLKVTKPRLMSEFPLSKRNIMNDTVNQSFTLMSGDNDQLKVKKYLFTAGVGCYGYVNTPGPGWNGNVYDTPEMLYAFNLGLEVSKADKMIRDVKNSTNTRIDINATSFTGMQRYYVGGVTAQKTQTIYLTKNYLTVGLISELRRKKESFLMNFCPGLNWTTGKIESVGREGFVTACVQMGEYYQHNFWSNKKNKEMYFCRLGFEQFFSLKGGYIGQFALIFGI